MKKLLIAAASLVALNTAALADDGSRFDFNGATNIGEITQGNGINAAFLTQFAAQDVDDVDIDDDAFLGDLEEVQEFQDTINVSQLVAGDEIEDVNVAGDDVDD